MEKSEGRAAVSVGDTVWKPLTKNARLLKREEESSVLRKLDGDTKHLPFLCIARVWGGWLTD